MKLGVNSVLFGNWDVESAFKYTAMAGYDGIELGAIPQMADHLDLDNWREAAPKLRQLAKDYGLEITAMEQSRQDFDLIEKACQAAADIGIPVVNCGPGGVSDDEETLQQSIDTIGKLADIAGRHGVTLCVKAHVGAAIYNTPTTIRLMEAVTSPSFGVDMDPSHIHRAGENPVEAIAAVISRVKHVHIRDCKGRQRDPGDPVDQANGRGDIDLVGYVRVLHEHGYDGPVNLEVIGTKAKGHSLENCCIIGAEARGHMQACLQAAGAR